MHRSTRPRALSIVVLTVAMTVASGVIPALPLAGAEAATSWQSGVYSGECGHAPVARFAAWRHARVERTSGYINPYKWSDLRRLAGVGGCLHGAGVPVTLSVAMLPSGSGTLRSGAKGAYNKYWTAFGRNAVHLGYSHATLRIGWEFNGNWYKWSAAKDPTHWKAYWRQIVRTLRKVHGEHFTFEWSTALGGNSTHFNPARAYPGNSYVSYIGSSVYDTWYGSSSASTAKRWKSLYSQAYGLRWLASFARQHHKKVTIAEWGLATHGSFGGHGNGDDRYFVSHFYSWVKHSNVKYEIYFNRRHASNEHRIVVSQRTNRPFRNASLTYRRSFGGL